MESGEGVGGGLEGRGFEAGLVEGAEAGEVVDDGGVLGPVEELGEGEFGAGGDGGEGDGGLEVVFEEGGEGRGGRVEEIGR